MFQIHQIITFIYCTGKKKLSLCLFLYWVCAFVHGLEPAISYSVTLSIFGNSWPPHPTHTNTQSRSNQNYNKKHTTKRLRDLWSTYVPHILSKKWKCWRTMTRLQYIYIYMSIIKWCGHVKYLLAYSFRFNLQSTYSQTIPSR